MSEETKIPRATGKGRESLENYNCAIFGMKGSRKTTFVEEILIAQKKRLIVIDTLCKDYGNDNFCKATGIRYDGTYVDYNAFIRKLNDLEHLKKQFRLIVRLPRAKIPDVLKLFVFNEEKQRSILTDTTLLIEEIAFFMTSNYIEPAILDHLQYGRHNQNNLIGVARVPTEVNPKFRSELDFVVSMSQQEDRAIRFFAEYDAGKAESLRTIEKGEPVLICGTEEDFLNFINQQ
jgi:hypothetical protein